MFGPAMDNALAFRPVLKLKPTMTVKAAESEKLREHMERSPGGRWVTKEERETGISDLNGAMPREHAESEGIQWDSR